VTSIWEGKSLRWDHRSGESESCSGPPSEGKKSRSSCCTCRSGKKGAFFSRKKPLRRGQALKEGEDKIAFFGPTAAGGVHLVFTPEEGDRFARRAATRRKGVERKDAEGLGCREGKGISVCGVKRKINETVQFPTGGEGILKEERVRLSP